MVYKTENQIKMILGINTWRNLLNEKLIRFTGMMPDMDRDMMMDLLGKLPQFWLLAKNTLDYLENTCPTDLSQEDQIMLRDIRKILNHELECESDQPVDIKQLTDLLVQNLGATVALDSKNREFLGSLQRVNQQPIRLKALAVLCYIGGRL